jgi:hypothetical protein
MVFLKQSIDNNKTAVNLAIRLHSLEQQEEKTNNNKPFGYSALKLSSFCFRVKNNNAMVFLKQLVNNSNKAVNLTIRLLSVDQQEEKTNKNKPFRHNTLNNLVSSLSQKTLFACRLALLLVHIVYLDAGMMCE